MLRVRCPQVKLFLLGLFNMGAVVLALSIGGMALLFSVLLYLIPVRGSRPSPDESFEESQERMRRHFREIRREHGEGDQGDI
jgi:hypothetical protein